MDAEDKRHLALTHALRTAMASPRWAVASEADRVSGLMTYLQALGYTITRIDPEVAAVAELLALERAGKIALHKYGELGIQKPWVAYNLTTGRTRFAPTAVELLAAVKAALKEATDAG